MFKVDNTESGDPSARRDYQQIKVNKEAILTHHCNTKRGDSGTPLIIQHDPTSKQCCSILGIHYGKLRYASGKQENKAVKITRKIVEQLSEF